MVVVSEGDAAGDAGPDAESLEARTAQVAESARSASVTAVSEGRNSFVSHIRFNIVRRSPREAFVHVRHGVGGKPQEHQDGNREGGGTVYHRKVEECLQLGVSDWSRLSPGSIGSPTKVRCSQRFTGWDEWGETGGGRAGRGATFLGKMGLELVR